MKRYDEQIAEANVVIKKYPKLRDAYLIRSDGQTNLKMYAEAIVSLDMAFKLAAPTPKLLLAKVRCLMNSERYSEAIAALNKIVEAEPSNATAFDRRSLWQKSRWLLCTASGVNFLHREQMCSLLSALPVIPSLM
ncbi:MAG: hypothetical protein C0508_14845 [Cyanobacteria bacterium PR.023]|nr:hypothetical protein [Cyanobacteria bacterium PR.023]